ncbi:hypothetical protein E1A91_D11G180400v1 [Gossypium mustelinum]|uniref:Uncharacterized protein n=1 Tax=Gossypium mustelinum TaxID=34275 RepID=A0A5D2STB9_GOSMU|nr:hypothetical protein E1A91_D11G180400v1 [Gossypium mustelinum]
MSRPPFPLCHLKICVAAPLPLCCFRLQRSKETLRRLSQWLVLLPSPFSCFALRKKEEKPQNKQQQKTIK